MNQIIQKILVIEDDQYTREMYRDVLESAGYKVDLASDGEDGLAKALVGGYSLILLDVMLPKRDGLSVLSSIKSASIPSPNGPIILVTNLSGNDILQEGIKFGAKACYVKTELNPEQLLTRVREYAISG
jgi:DNA-binding response OmpR family regulator